MSPAALIPNAKLWSPPSVPSSVTVPAEPFGSFGVQRNARSVATGEPTSIEPTIHPSAFTASATPRSAAGRYGSSIIVPVDPFGADGVQRNGCDIHSGSFE